MHSYYPRYGPNNIPSKNISKVNQMFNPLAFLNSSGALNAVRNIGLEVFENGEHGLANIIMVGTPNAGSPLADLFVGTDPCRPAIYDLVTSASDTHAAMNPNTNYYTIAGDWDPLTWVPKPTTLFNCEFDTEGHNYLSSLGFANDGMVPIDSVESKSYFHNLGHTSDCHQGLTDIEEYQLARPILLGR
jgi:hypothetical protein